MNLHVSVTQFHQLSIFFILSMSPLNVFPYIFFNFNFILYWFQVYSLVVRKSYYVLHSILFGISSTQLAPYVVTIILLTMLYIHPHDYFVTTNLCFSVPSPLLLSPPSSLTSGRWIHTSVCFMSKYLSMHTQ